MSEHVKRGATKETNREVRYEWDTGDRSHINSIWCCTECDSVLEVRQRADRPAYISLECDCGAEALDLRVGDLLEFEMDSWGAKTVSELGRVPPAGGENDD
jgi:hypothetical protein